MHKLWDFSTLIIGTKHYSQPCMSCRQQSFRSFWVVLSPWPWVVFSFVWVLYWILLLLISSILFLYGSALQYFDIQTLAALAFLASQLHPQLGEASRLPVGPSLCITTWKHSSGSKLGQSWSSPHLIPVSKGSLSFTSFCSVSSEPLFYVFCPVFCFRMEVNYNPCCSFNPFSFLWVCNFWFSKKNIYWVFVIRNRKP